MAESMSAERGQGVYRADAALIKERLVVEVDGALKYSERAGCSG